MRIRARARFHHHHVIAGILVFHFFFPLFSPRVVVATVATTAVAANQFSRVQFLFAEI